MTIRCLPQLEELKNYTKIIGAQIGYLTVDASNIVQSPIIGEGFNNETKSKIDTVTQISLVMNNMNNVMIDLINECMYIEKNVCKVDDYDEVKRLAIINTLPLIFKDISEYMSEYKESYLNNGNYPIPIQRKQVGQEDLKLYKDFTFDELVDTVLHVGYVVGYINDTLKKKDNVTNDIEPTIYVIFAHEGMVFQVAKNSRNKLKWIIKVHSELPELIPSLKFIIKEYKNQLKEINKNKE